MNSLNIKRERNNEEKSIVNLSFSENSGPGSDKSDMLSIVDSINSDFFNEGIIDLKTEPGEIIKPVQPVKIEMSCRKKIENFSRSGKKFEMKLKRKIFKEKFRKEEKFIYHQCPEEIKSIEFMRKFNEVREKKLINIYNQDSILISEKWIPKYNIFENSVNIYVKNFLKINQNSNFSETLQNLNSTVAKVKIWDDDEFIKKLSDHICITSDDSNNSYLIVGKEILKIYDKQINFLLIRVDNNYIDKIIIDILSQDDNYYNFDDDDNTFIDDPDMKYLDDLEVKIAKLKVEQNEQKLLKEEYDKKMSKLNQGRKIIDEKITDILLELENKNKTQITNKEHILTSKSEKEKIESELHQMEADIKFVIINDINKLIEIDTTLKHSIKLLNDEINQILNPIKVEEKEDINCQICFNSRPEVVYLPCRHFKYCKTCYTKSNYPNCEYCNQKIDKRHYVKFN